MSEKDPFKILEDCLSKAPDDDSDILVPLEIPITDHRVAAVINHIHNHHKFKTHIATDPTTTITIKRSRRNAKSRRDHSRRVN